MAKKIQKMNIACVEVPVFEIAQGITISADGCYGVGQSSTMHASLDYDPSLTHSLRNLTLLLFFFPSLCSCSVHLVGFLTFVWSYRSSLRRIATIVRIVLDP